MPHEQRNVEAHLEWCVLRNLRPRTVEARRNALARFIRATGSDPVKMDRKGMSRWFAQVPGVAETRAAELSHVRSYLRWARDAQLTTGDPTKHLPAPKIPRRFPRPITEKKLTAALQDAEPVVTVILTLAAYAGLRAAEIAQLCWSDIDEDGHLILVTDGKGGKQRTVPLHPAVVVALARLPVQRRGPVLARRDGRAGHWTHYGVSKYANNHLHGLGYPDTLHSLRHRYGTSLYFVSHDLRMVQDLLGHASPTTTAGYTAWDRRAASAVVNQLP